MTTVAIAGAGIGGLTLAALLHRSGHDVKLVEQASALGDVGAGIQLSPNGARILHRLGLGESLAALGTAPERVVVRRWDDDRELAAIPLGSDAAARWGWPYYNVYRPDLVAVLADAVAEVPIRFGSRVVGASTSDAGGQLHLADGTTIGADVIVGADGIHSRVRGSLLGAQSARYSHSVAYRALVPAAAVADLPVEVTNRLGPGAHIVTYFVGRDRSLLNVVCVVPEEHWTLETWDAPGDLAALQRHFERWSPRLRSILDEVAEPVFKWALYDREPLDRWTSGAVTLLGDACHPMLPFMAQGACQAIEDAATLATLLDHHEPALALMRYELIRKPRTAEIQQRSWAMRTTYHLADGDEQRARDEALATTGAGALASFDWLYGHDPVGAASPSMTV